MFCYQCQETAKGTGCTIKGVCGKEGNTSNLQDLLIHNLKGLALLSLSLDKSIASYEALISRIGRATGDGLFATITNANFDEERIKQLIRESFDLRQDLLDHGASSDYDGAQWIDPESKWLEKSLFIGILAEPNEDLRSLKELITYGLKGVGAYLSHAFALGYEDLELWTGLLTILGKVAITTEQESLISLTMKTGELAVKAMALLDKANNSTYGHPEITEVKLGVGTRPGILVSGHDLKDLEMLLEQSKDKGVDIYTHSEMLPAHYYPHFKKYEHFWGNYGNAWWKQDKEFEAFKGVILMTTNCLTPIKGSYKDRIYTTGNVGFKDIPHIEERNGFKDFSPLIEKALSCAIPTELESGTIVGGFGHHQVLALADKVVAAVKSGDIKRFVVMAGCDGRQKGRSYFEDVADNLPKDTIILTAGCAKYRYIKKNLGDIKGIPRVLDAGQCNDSYSLALIALKLKEVFQLDDINELPLSFDIAWYEQKAVAVLLALLSLGVKGIRLGPTLPSFLSPGVLNFLIDNFGITATSMAQDDIEKMMAGI